MDGEESPCVQGEPDRKQIEKQRKGQIRDLGGLRNCVSRTREYFGQASRRKKLHLPAKDGLSQKWSSRGREPANQEKNGGISAILAGDVCLFEETMGGGGGLKWHHVVRIMK